MIILKKFEFVGLLHEAFDPDNSSKLAIDIAFEETGDIDTFMGFTTNDWFTTGLSKILD